MASMDQWALQVHKVMKACQAPRVSNCDFKVLNLGFRG